MMPCKIEKNIGNHYKQACNFFIIQSNKKVLILNHFVVYWWAFLYCYTDAAGNFLCPAENLSFNAFKTVMEIDAHGTFNVSKAVFDKYMKVIY